MRINRLELQGIGPFRNKVEIDFDKLGASGLYLIDGETGSGKSTLIDAIVYGIYGQLAASTSDIGRLRSKFSADSEESYVEVDFTTAKGLYRVRRSPAYMRVAKRGGNGSLTKQNPSAQLFSINNDGVLNPVENKINTLETLISTDIIGLTKTQFAQTVVLPQGEFANFLRAETKERAVLMEKLFGTELYTRIIQLLKDDAAALVLQLATYQKQANLNLLQKHEAAEISLDELSNFASLIDSATFDQVIDMINLRLNDFSVERVLIENAYEDSKKASALAAKTRDLRITEAAAQKLVDDVSAEVVAKQEKASTQFELAIAQSADYVRFGVDVHGLKLATEFRSATESLNAIRVLTETNQVNEARVLAWPTESNKYESKIAKVAEELNDLEKAETGMPADIDALKIAIEKMPETLVLQNSKQKQLADLQKSLLKIQELERSEKALADSTTKLRAISTKTLSAQSALSDAQQHRIKNISGELATELKPGSACVVCGSTKHPNPAQYEGTLISAEEVADLQETYDALQTEQGEISNLVAANQQAVDSLQASVNELGDVQGNIKSLEKDLKDLASLIEGFEAKKEEKERLETEKQNLADRMADLRNDQTKLLAELKTKTAELAKLQESLTKHLGDFETLDIKLDLLVELITILVANENAFAELETSKVQAEDASLKLSEFEMHPAFGDIDGATEVLNLAKELEDGSHRAQEASQRKDSALNSILNSLNKQRDSYSREIASNSDLLLLSQTFSKDDENQQTLTIYVLAKLFENVLAGANRYLEGLLSAQFRLEIDQEDGNKNGVRGLGIRVFDSFAGDFRSAKTLSGGETFCVSLALALGLADYVRQGAGGIEIGTLFIDEGFGTLSDGPLNDVMNMLTSLQKNGRTVGLISHVDEMKAQINEKIEVQKASKDNPAKVTVSWHE